MPQPPVRPRRDPAEIAQDLQAAMDAFREALEEAGGDPGPTGWPPLTESLKEAVHRVRDLREELRKELAGLPGARWPAQLRECLDCRGAGVTYRLADEDKSEWFTTDPCGSCLTTGLAALRRPVRTDGSAAPAQRSS